MHKLVSGLGFKVTLVSCFFQSSLRVQMTQFKNAVLEIFPVLHLLFFHFMK